GSLVGAVVALILVVRDTRSDEQRGRMELLLGGRAARREHLLAAIAVVSGTGVAVGAFACLGLLAAGMPADGSVLLGLVLTASILFFTAVGAVCAQIATEPGAAGGLGAALLAVLLAIAAVSDAIGSPL
ncbi:MAG: hypothetical protein KJ041_05250, partial [Gammaproteobacteria bacterium]|nr:hypothetical protein [Gammaproteobacteria bacterium]